MLALKRLLRIGMTYTNTDISDIPSCKAHYIIAVCYHMHSPLALRYIAESIVSDKKIAWINNDFFTTGFPIRKLSKYLYKYYGVVAVSDTVRKEFIQLCPSYKEKTYMCHNIINESEITQKANVPSLEDFYAQESSPKLLTIGRFVNQKGFDLAIRAAQILKQNKIDFKWFFIGYGEQESECRHLITECNVADRVIILGKKNNPYPYLKKCDIYVHPSRYEAYSKVILEAKLLNRPIICSHFAGSDEQIIHDKNGLIVSVGDVGKLANAIEELTLLRLCKEKKLKIKNGMILKSILKICSL